ncbi:uncharacterized protein LOC128955076 [Oppia nitens]|uniref:uncharacterized protein LOC128955076 n=1 Tax=Oppia nitens TaxID=1686743 RepID=UPI0023DB433C|nr:uncharacterized protein LOC128955076 [Oppia nitens]
MIMAYKCQTKRSNSNTKQLMLSHHHWWPTIRSVHTIKKDKQNINIQDIKQRSDQTVVKVVVPSYQDSNKCISFGSGFRVNGDEMMIITNAHVVQGSQLVGLIMHLNGWLDLLTGLVCYVEPQRDLALIELKNVDNDRFHAQPFDISRQQTNKSNIFAEPVASIGPTETLGCKSCQSGIVQTHGITVGQQRTAGQIVIYSIDDSTRLIRHSSETIIGYSGGPTLTSEANVIGVQVMNRVRERFSFGITCNDIFDFLANSRHYRLNGFNDRRLQRTVSYTLRPGYKLGLIVSNNTIDDNNTDLIIDSSLPESLNYEYIGHQIIDTNIRQIANQLNGVNPNNNIISLTMRSMADTTKQWQLMSMTAIDYTQQNLPIIF